MATQTTTRYDVTVEAAASTYATGIMPVALLAAALRVAARMADQAGLPGMAESLFDSADTAERGYPLSACYDARDAARQIPVPGANDAASQKGSPRTTTVDVDHDVVKVRLCYVDGFGATARRVDERLTMTLRQALAVCARPAVGVRAMRLTAALEAHPDVKGLADGARAARAAARKLGLELVRLHYLSVAKWDGGWGSMARQAAVRLLTTLRAAGATAEELRCAMSEGERLMGSPKVALARLAGSKLRKLYTEAATEDALTTEDYSSHDVARELYSAALRKARSLVDCELSRRALDNRERLYLVGDDEEEYEGGRVVGTMPTMPVADVQLASLAWYEVKSYRAPSVCDGQQLTLTGVSEWARSLAWTRTGGRTRSRTGGQTSSTFQARWAVYTGLVFGTGSKLPSALVAPSTLVSNTDHDAHVVARAEWAERRTMARVALGSAYRSGRVSDAAQLSLLA